MDLLSFLCMLSLPAGAQPDGAASAPPIAGKQTAADHTVAVDVAVPFHLAQGWRYTWRADRPVVDAGWLLVVEVDPALARPTQGLTPVLMVGSWPAERLSWSDQDSHMVVIVPESLDLAETPVFWGPATLPEQLDPARCDAAAAAARHAGAVGVGAVPLAAALLAGGGPRSLADRKALYALAAELVATWVPDQAERVAPWREASP